MAETAEYGLMLGDGKSKGTVNNVVNLSRDHKPVVVYVAPTRQFRTIKLTANVSSSKLRQVVEHATLGSRPWIHAALTWQLRIPARWQRSSAALRQSG